MCLHEFFFLFPFKAPLSVKIGANERAKKEKEKKDMSI
jgi:hypothetical protein